MNDWIIPAFDRIADLARRRAGWVIGFVIVVTGLAAGLAAQLRIDANLKRLVARDAPSIVSLNRLERAYGGRIGRLTVVLGGETTDELKAIADRLAPRLGRLAGVDRVEVKRPRAFFARYRLLYADHTDLETVQERLQRRIRWEKRRANPLFVDLSDEEPPSLEMDDLVEGREALEGSPYYLDETETRLALFVHPSFSANDLARARDLTRRVGGAVRAQLEEDGSGVTLVGLTGRYKKRVDLQRLITRDLGRATLLAAGLLLTLLWLFCGGISGAVVVLAPLLVGTVWTAAWAEIAFDSLNILTGFIGAILLGLGVDYGLHLYLRYAEAREHCDLGEALRRTLRSSGRANTFAALTTMVPMATLLISDFRAFYEFGAIAVVGIGLILLAYLLLVPALVALAGRVRLRLSTPLSARWQRRGDSNARAATPTGSERSLGRAPLGAAVALALGVVVAIPGLMQLDFVRDFHVLQSTDAPSWRLDRMVNRILGRSQTPSIVLATSPAHARRLDAELERRRREAPHGDTIGEVLTIRDILPERQTDKLELLRSMQREAEEIPDDARTDELSARLRELERVLAEAPLRIDDLPRNLRAPFERRDDSASSVVLIFPAVDLTEMDAVEAFVAVLRDLPGIDRERGYDALSEATLLYDVIRYVERDSRRMLVLTLFGLLAVSLAALRDVRETVVQFGLLGIAMVWALGALGWFGLDFNFMNVVMLPIWLGLGIDATFHMILDARDEPFDLPPHATTAAAIAAAFWTTAIGFGSMLVARHRGLDTLGSVATCGLIAIWIVHLLGHLVLLGWRQRAHAPDPDEESDTRPEEVAP